MVLLVPSMSKSTSSLPETLTTSVAILVDAFVSVAATVYCCCCDTKDCALSSSWSQDSEEHSCLNSVVKSAVAELARVLPLFLL